MAAHTVAAAQCSLGRCFLWLFVYLLVFVLCTFCWVNNIYSRHDLLKIGVCYKWSVTAEFLHSYKSVHTLCVYVNNSWCTNSDCRQALLPGPGVCDC